MASSSQCAAMAKVASVHRPDLQASPFSDSRPHAALRHFRAMGCRVEASLVDSKSIESGLLASASSGAAELGSRSALQGSFRLHTDIPKMRPPLYGRTFELTGQSCLCGHIISTGSCAGPVSCRLGVNMSIALII